MDTTMTPLHAPPPAPRPAGHRAQAEIAGGLEKKANAAGRAAGVGNVLLGPLVIDLREAATRIRDLTVECAASMATIAQERARDRESTRLNSSHSQISYA